MTSNQENALKIITNMLAPEMSESMKTADSSPLFAGQIGELAFSNVFEKLWVRDALDLRTRSLVTLGILIALRANEEMAVHFPAAVRNGATLEEITEVILHATGYAGFPAANTARSIAEASLREAGMFPAAEG